jgi:hypothetical protein
MAGSTWSEKVISVFLQYAAAISATSRMVWTLPHSYRVYAK